MNQDIELDTQEPNRAKARRAEMKDAENYYVTLDKLDMLGYTVTAQSREQAEELALNMAWHDNPDAGEITVVNVEESL